MANAARQLKVVQPRATARVVFDFTVQNEGTISILWPKTDAAREWVDQHIPNEAQRWCGDGVVIEHRYVGDILFAIDNDGLVLGRA